MTEMERIIRRTFQGKSNAGLRQRVRAVLAAGHSPMVLRHTIAFTALGLAGLRLLDIAARERGLVNEEA